MSARRRWMGLGVIVVAFFIFLAWWRMRDDTPKNNPANHSITRARKTLEIARAKHAAIKNAPSRSERPRGAGDPIQRVLVSEDSKYGVVVELGAVASSTIGGMIADCMGLRDPGGPLAATAASKIDLGRSVDRLAFIDGAVIASGSFGELASILPFAGTKYGDLGQTFAIPDFAALGFSHGGSWRGEILIAAASQSIVERTIDRLENRLPEGSPLVPEDEAYGNLYGTIDVAGLAKSLGLPEAKWSAFGDRRAIFHADVEGDLYQSLEIPIGAAESAEVKRVVDDVVKERRAAVPKKPSPMDANLREAIDAVVTSTVDGGVRIEATYPASHLNNWLASCRIGRPHAPPPGWSTKPQALIRGFAGPEPPGMIGMRPNVEKLKSTNPQLALMLMASGDFADKSWVDPLTLQTVTFTAKTGPGLCNKLEKIVASGRMYGPMTAIRDPKGRTWRRSTKVDEASGAALASYVRCADDRLWDLAIMYQKRVLPSVVFARFEHYLGELELTSP